MTPLRNDGGANGSDATDRHLRVRDTGRVTIANSGEAATVLHPHSNGQ